MARFFPLTVTDLRKTIRDAVVVTLKPIDGADFSFAPGQYLTFRRDFDGVELRRSYSVCAGLDDGVLQVGIKRVDGGAFSTFANRDLRVGETLEAMTPMGQFQVDLDRSGQHYLGIAGGSGITPIMSILKTVLARDPDSRFTLIYANRGPSSIMFREELEDLKNLHLRRLQVIHVLESDAQEIDLLSGRLDPEKCDALFGRLVDIGSVDMALICGPEPMMLTVREALRRHGVEDDRIKIELFKSGQPGRAKTKAAVQVDATSKGATARVTIDGIQQQIVITPGQTVLEAALEAGLDVPFACTAGVCSTCRCQVTKGKVEMEVNHALEDYEVVRGFALSCQSRPVTDELELTYDSH